MKAFAPPKGLRRFPRIIFAARDQLGAEKPTEKGAMPANLRYASHSCARSAKLDKPSIEQGSVAKLFGVTDLPHDDCAQYTALSGYLWQRRVD